MQSHTTFLICGLLAASAAAFHGQEEPVITGYVSRAHSKSDFDVNGVRVLCNKNTRGLSQSVSDANATVDCPGDLPYVGESMAVFYTMSEGNAVYATRIEKQPSPRFGEISGSAVIDAPPAEQESGKPPSVVTVCADGYHIRITAKTSIEWNPPLQSLADVKAGNWIKYKGKIDAARVLVAASVQIGPSTISSGEEKLRTKSNFDPSAVPPDSRQNYLTDALAGGYDAKKFPLFRDAGMQARIERVGNSLIPSYQRALPDSDPAKIKFRFQLIDTKLFRETLALPSGIILVPHQGVERMQNDSQLAAVLADGIARVLEKQQYRTEGKIKAGYALMLAAPIAPFAAFGGNVAMEIQKKEREQRDRVSLSLLHDAGYDIAEAPMAWWLLGPEKTKPLSKIEMPERTAYLYSILGEIWRNPVASASSVH